jgi:hypothetical protein
MKKFKLGTFLAMLIILGSCNEEKVDQPDAIQKEVVEEVGLVDGGYVYPPADEYSSKFNYFHNGVKLTDKKMIQGMLQNAIHFSAEELNIEIALSENEKQAIEAKNNQEDLKVINSAQKAVPRKGRIFHNIYYKATSFHGPDNRTYPHLFHPQIMKFANVSNKTVRVHCLYRNIKKKGEKASYVLLLKSK